jgi:hypothetical protein
VVLTLEAAVGGAGELDVGGALVDHPPPQPVVLVADDLDPVRLQCLCVDVREQRPLQAGADRFEKPGIQFLDSSPGGGRGGLVFEYGRGEYFLGFTSQFELLAFAEL